MVWLYNAGMNRILDGVFLKEEDIFGNVYITQKVEGLMALSGLENNEKNRDIVSYTWNKLMAKYLKPVMVIREYFKILTKKNPFDSISWKLPDGSVAQYANVYTESKELHFVDEYGYERQHTSHMKMIDPEKGEKSTGLLPRIIHSIDAYVKRQFLLRTNEMGIVVVPNHDSFTFDKKYLSTCEKIMKDIYIEVLEGDVFANIVHQVNRTNSRIILKDKNGNQVGSDIFGDKLTAEDIKVCRMWDEE